ncbi:MAG: hypothetical protein ACLP4V_22330 [Methylocella sp.]
MGDKVIHGTLSRGEKHVQACQRSLYKYAKLTEPEVRIIKMFGEWGFKGGEIITLAGVYGVSGATIYGIFGGRIWKHVEARPR